jgi:hypothetical protein
MPFPLLDTLPCPLSAWLDLFLTLSPMLRAEGSQVKQREQGGHHLHSPSLPSSPALSQPTISSLSHNLLYLSVHPPRSSLLQLLVGFPLWVLDRFARCLRDGVLFLLDGSEFILATNALITSRSHIGESLTCASLGIQYDVVLNARLVVGIGSIFMHPLVNLQTGSPNWRQAHRPIRWRLWERSVHGDQRLLGD